MSGATEACCSSNRDAPDGTCIPSESAAGSEATGSASVVVGIVCSRHSRLDRHARLVAVVIPFPRMPMRPTVHVDLLVPVADNDGHPFHPDTLASFEAHLLALAGGFTRKGEVAGVWRDEAGRTYRDRSRLYSLTVPRERATAIATTLDRSIRDAFRQEASFVELLPTVATTF